MPSKRVWIFLNAFRHGGSQTYALELTRRLRAHANVLVVAKAGPVRPLFRDADVETKAVRWREGYATMPLPVHRRAAHSVRELWTKHELRREAAVEAPDLVIASQPWPIRFASGTPWNTECPIVALYHGPSKWEFPPAGGRATIASIDAHFTISDEAADALEPLIGTRPVVLGNLFDGAAFWRQSDAWLCPRNEQPRHVTLVSTMTATKALPVSILLEALSLRLSDWTATVVGEGPELHHHRAHAQSLGVAERVAFTGGTLDPRPFYLQATVVIGMGRAALEPASRGVPVVIASEDGLRGPLLPSTYDDAMKFNFTGRGGCPTLSVDSLTHSILGAASLSADDRNEVAHLASHNGDTNALEQLLRD